MDRFDQYIIDKSPDWFRYEELKVANNSRFSSLMPWFINDVSAVLRQNLNFYFTRIVDITGNVGCDSILFRILFPNVDILTFEKDKDVFNILKENVENLDRITNNPNVKSIDIINADCLDYLYTLNLTTSILYLDPPWEGKDYKSKKNMDLFLSGTNVIDIIAFTKAPLIILKVPVNYNFAALNVFKNVKSYAIRTESGKISYYLLFITK